MGDGIGITVPHSILSICHGALESVVDGQRAIQTVGDGFPVPLRQGRPETGGRWNVTTVGW